MSFASDLRAVVQHRDFRRLYATRLAGQASDGLFQVALASYVFFTPERQATAGAAAATFAVLLLPYTVVGPFAGVLLDRWRRRQVLAHANVARAAMVVVVAAVAAAGVTGPGLYVTALAALSVNRFVLTALSASLPHVVERRELIMANSVSVTSGSMAALSGGMLGLALHWVAPDPALMLAAAAGYLASATLALRLDADLLGPDQTIPVPHALKAVRHVARGLYEGASHVWARPAARNALAVITAQRFCYGTGTVAALLLYRNYFNDPASDGDAAMTGLASVFAAAGLGYFVAAMVTPEITPRIGKPAWIVTAMVGAAVFGFALGAPYQPPPLVMGSFLLGVAAQAVKISVDTIVQEAIADGFRGRVFAFYDVLFNAAFVAAAAVAALTMPESGKSYAILTAVTAGYALAAGLYLRAHLRSRAEAPPRRTALGSAPQDVHPSA